MAQIEVISFRKEIPANSKDWLAERLKYNGRVKSLKVEFYLQGKALQIRPYLERRGGQMQSLITFASTTEQYLSGDDSYLEFTMNLDFRQDNYVKIYVENTSQTDPYDLSLDLVVEYDN